MVLEFKSNGTTRKSGFRAILTGENLFLSRDCHSVQSIEIEYLIVLTTWARFRIWLEQNQNKALDFLKNSIQG